MPTQYQSQDQVIQLHGGHAKGTHNGVELHIHHMNDIVG